MSAKELIADAVEAVEDAKVAAKGLIETLGNKIIDLLDNGAEEEELRSFAQELIDDANELSEFVLVNTPAAEEPTPTPTPPEEPPVE